MCKCGYFLHIICFDICATTMYYMLCKNQNTCIIHKKGKRNKKIRIEILKVVNVFVQHMKKNDFTLN